MRGRVGVAVALLLLAGGRARSSAAATPKDTLTIGAALSLTGSLSREGVLTREGYDRCAEVVNRKGGVHVGDRTYRPVVAEQVRPLYELGAGDLTVDLSTVNVSDLGAPIRTRIDHGVGDLTVLVPASADVRISVDQGIGNLDVLGQGATDGYFAGTGPAAWTDDGKPEFVLTIDSGAGDVEVSRA